MNGTDILWTSVEAAAVTGGKASREWQATGVSIAMEDLRPGDLYFATRDDDLEEVFRKGAAAAVIAGGTGSDKDWPVLQVPDVYQALQNMAGAARFRAQGNIIAAQGKKARRALGDILGHMGRVHEGGKHLSLGLAGLPDTADYGIFAASPAVRPDITLITNPAAAQRDTLFETMPAGGAVIVNADDEEYLRVIVRARAAGVQTILTYGESAGADARICEIIRTQNAARLHCNILGEEITCLLPGGFEAGPVLAAALLVMKLDEKPLSLIAQSLESRTPAFGAEEAGPVHFLDDALRRKETLGVQTVFRITSMIDLGAGRQTAVLDNFTGRRTRLLPKNNLVIPRRHASLDFVYTSKRLDAVSDAQRAIRESHKNMQVEPIVPEVIVPGDFLVFREAWDKSRAVLSDALRLVPPKGRGRIKTGYVI